jgi:hypothetical protein
MMSVQRVFHRSRVGRFPVVELTDIRAQLEGEISSQAPNADTEELNRLIAEIRTGTTGPI